MYVLLWMDTCIFSRFSLLLFFCCEQRFSEYSCRYCWYTDVLLLGKPSRVEGNVQIRSHQSTASSALPKIMENCFPKFTCLPAPFRPSSSLGAVWLSKFCQSSGYVRKSDWVLISASLIDNQVSVLTVGFSFCNGSAWLKLWLPGHPLPRELSQINTLLATGLGKEPGHLPQLRLFCFRDLGWFQ